MAFGVVVRSGAQVRVLRNDRLAANGDLAQVVDRDVVEMGVLTHLQQPWVHDSRIGIDPRGLRDIGTKESQQAPSPTKGSVGTASHECQFNKPPEVAAKILRKCVWEDLGDIEALKDLPLFDWLPRGAPSIRVFLMRVLGGHVLVPSWSRSYVLVRSGMVVGYG